MTPAQQPKGYCISCGHCKQEETGFKTKRPRCEITRWFLDMYCVQEMVSKIGCKHDTRSHPHPAPEPDVDELKTINAMLEAEVDRLTGIEAEAARRQAREESQQRIDAVIKELGHLRDGQYNDIVGHNVRYAYDYAIILLRQQAGDHK